MTAPRPDIAERVKIARAVAITGESTRTLQALAASGRIPGAARLSRCWTFDVLDLEAWTVGRHLPPQKRPPSNAAGKRPGRIYFVQGGDFIKIGWTGPRGLRARLSTLQTACPFKLSLLHTMRGTPEEEWCFHASFRADRAEGEWFRASPRLLDFIAGLKSKKR